MWLITIVVLLVAAGVAYVIFSGNKTPRPSHDTYVCDVCNERECVCRKEEEKP